MMKMRSQYVPEEIRSTIMNVFRVPLNLFVCVVLYNVDKFPMQAVFTLCSVFLIMSLFCQRRLAQLAASAPSSKSPEDGSLPVTH
jgi:MFS transporter, MFS domain-containing protein family, molybdate-anion transporter